MRLFGGKIESPKVEFHHQTKVWFGYVVMLIVSSDIRFGSHYLSMQRIHKCRRPLIHTSTHKNFLALKIKGFDDVLDVLHKETTWEARRVLVVVLEPWMQVLRLADSYKAHMDKLLFLLYRAIAFIKNSTLLDDANLFPGTEDSTEAVSNEDDSDDDSIVPPGGEEAETNDGYIPLPYRTDEEGYNEDEDEDEDGDEDEVPGTQLGTPSSQGDSLKERMLAVVERYQPLLEHPYARIGYHLSVVPAIFDHSKVSDRAFVTLLLSLVTHQQFFNRHRTT